MNSSPVRIANDARRETAQISPNPSKSESQKRPGLKIINAALPRMGTKSMALAYQTLGFKAYHALFDEISEIPWSLLEQAAEAIWPDATGPTSSPHPRYTREDWDRLWGNEYDVVTDQAAPFTLELIKAYPDAKVVVIQRDFESWWTSFKSRLLDPLTEPRSALMRLLNWNRSGSKAACTLRRLIFGFFGARTREGCEKNAKMVYERYYEDVRKAVPENRRLEYEISQGWAPLCEFLGVEVPNTEFPWVNSQVEFHEEIKVLALKLWIGAIKSVWPGVVGVVIVLLALLIIRE
ncbi:hypothetical protein VTI28DRAFT_566 [Corynascus sepedonium]